MTSGQETERVYSYSPKARTGQKYGDVGTESIILLANFLQEYVCQKL